MMYQLSMKTDERVMRALKNLYSAYGYQSYKVSKFEEYDLYVQNKSFLTSEIILTFSDTNGRLMALKPDVTLSIVKNTRITDKVRKVFYTENVYRVPNNADGFQEIMQTGLEYIGDVDDYATAEVLLLAERSLREIRGRYVLDISHIGVISGLLHAAKVTEPVRELLLTAVGEKNAPELRRICREQTLPQNLADTICTLMGLYGPLDQMLPQVQAMELPCESREALQSLQTLSTLLLQAGCCNLMLDFSVVNAMDYYTGIVFRGFVEGASAGVLSGGRYDSLLSRMGREQGAIGFAVYLDQLERLYTVRDDFDVDVLVLYDDSSDLSTVLKTAEELTNSGKCVRVQRQQNSNLRSRSTLKVTGTEVTEVETDD